MQEHQRSLASIAKLDKVRGLHGGLGEQDAVVGDNADRMAINMGKASDDCRAVLGLKFREFTAVNDARDDFAYVVGCA